MIQMESLGNRLEMVSIENQITESKAVIILGICVKMVYNVLNASFYGKRGWNERTTHNADGLESTWI
jgi:hypothetical protein